jgi:hypothetical protein
MPVESEADLAGFFDPADFAVKADYQPAGGSYSPVSVLWAAPSSLLGGFGATAARTVAREAIVRLAELPDQRAKRGDRVRYAGLVYAVETQTPDDAGVTVRLALSGPVPG